MEAPGDEASFLEFISRERISLTGQGDPTAPYQWRVLEQLLSSAPARFQN